MKTDFERLVIARHYIEVLKNDAKILKTEVGMMQSEIDELKYTLENQNKLTKEEKIQIKTNQFYQVLKSLNHKKDKIIRGLKRDKETLIIKLHS